MKKNKKMLFLTAFMIIAAMIISCSMAFAASATVSVTGGTVKKGETISVKVTYGGAKYGSAATEVNYDKSYLEFVSCSEVSYGSGGKTTVSLEGINVDSLSFTIKFKALKAGSTTVNVNTVEAYNVDGEELTASAKSAKVTIKDKSSSASSNANLSSLKVSAGTLSPAFSADKTSYKVNVGNDVTSCTLSLSTAHAKASYKVSGDSSLKVGENVRKITVTAENGKTKTYTITIIRAEKSSSSGSQGDSNNGNNNSDKPETDKPEEEDTEKEPEQLETTIDGKEYIVCENIDNKKIPQNFTMTVAKYEGKEIPVFKDAELKYTIALLQNKETGDEGWFFYNEKNDTFKKTVSLKADKIIEYEEIMAKSGENKPVQLSKKVSTETVLFVALGGTLTLLLMAVLIMQYNILKSRKK